MGLYCPNEDGTTTSSSSTTSTTSSSSLFSDDFNRADGAIGDNYLTSFATSAGNATIKTNQVCGDSQSFAMYKNTLSGKIKISFKWTAASTTGLEAYAIMSTDSTGSKFALLGCDGGGGSGNQCALKIKDEAGTTLATENQTLTTGTTYLLEGEISGTTLTARLKKSDGTSISTITGTLSASYSPQYFGLLVGRNTDTQLTCADDLKIEQL